MKDLKIKTIPIDMNLSRHVQDYVDDMEFTKHLMHLYFDEVNEALKKAENESISRGTKNK